MPQTNTLYRYGRIAKIFHWSTALLIATLIPLGILASDAPTGSEAELLRKALLFSWHKTLGVTLFFIAVLRIVWAITQPKPAPLHPEARGETFLAEMVHWLLYASLVLVPLTGWLHHSAATVAAPIWGPLERLPFVPRSDAAAHVFGALHIIFERVLVVSILLHVAGALKHVVIDRDGTLARMWFGTFEAGQPGARHAVWPAVAGAVAVWIAALGIGAAIGMFAPTGTAGPAPAAPRAQAGSQWQVETGQIGFSVAQFGTATEGQFSDWSAAIAYDPDTGTGAVQTDIAITSLALGSATEQALAPAYFDAQTHPQARWEGVISREAGQHWARGTLTLRGVAQQVDFPFTLVLEGNSAQMQATLDLDRLAFGIGPEGEDTVGMAVTVTLSLTATRQP